MKFLTLIILLISVAATFIPCCEFDNCGNRSEKVSETGNQEEDKSCSPFSICQACVGAAVLAKPIEIASPEYFIQGQLPDEVDSKLPSHHAAFWQPPRFALRS